MLGDDIADSDFNAILGHLEKRKEQRAEKPQIPTVNQSTEQVTRKNNVQSHIVPESIPHPALNPPRASEKVVYTMQEDDSTDPVLVEDNGEHRLTKGHLFANMLKQGTKKKHHLEEIETRKMIVLEKALSITINQMRARGASGEYIKENFGAIERRVREELGI